MGKKTKKKQFSEEENLGEAPAEQAETPAEEQVPSAPAETEAPKEPREINEDNVALALKELGGKASASAIRKQLGQPVVRQTREPLHWYAADVRNAAAQLEQKGKIKVVSEKRTQVYELVEDAPAEEVPQ